MRVLQNILEPARSSHLGNIIGSLYTTLNCLLSSRARVVVDHVPYGIRRPIVDSLTAVLQGLD